MTKEFLFKCDCNEESGFGHFSRCLNLARWLLLKDNDFEITFLGDYNAFALLLLNKYTLDYLVASKEYSFDPEPITLKASEYHTLICDSYLINQEFVDTLTNQNFKSVFFLSKTT